MQEQYGPGLAHVHSDHFFHRQCQDTSLEVQSVTVYTCGIGMVQDRSKDIPMLAVGCSQSAHHVTCNVVIHDQRVRRERLLLNC